MKQKTLLALSQIDPKRITIEDVQHFVCWRWAARLVLATAVRRGDFLLNNDGTYRLRGLTADHAMVSEDTRC